MLDWLAAQAISAALSWIADWLLSKGFTDAAAALGKKAAKDIVAEVKTFQASPDYPSQDTKGQPTF